MLRLMCPCTNTCVVSYALIKLPPYLCSVYFSVLRLNSDVCPCIPLVSTSVFWDLIQSCAPVFPLWVLQCFETSFNRVPMYSPCEYFNVLRLNSVVCPCIPLVSISLCWDLIQSCAPVFPLWVFRCVEIYFSCVSLFWQLHCDPCPEQSPCFCSMHFSILRLVCRCGDRGLSVIRSAKPATPHVSVPCISVF